MKKERGLQKQNTRKPPSISGVLIEDLRSMIENTRQSVASTINASITALYWNIGHRIHLEILREERAEYGKTIVASLSRQLTLDYGNGFAEKYLRKIIQFAEVFPDEQIVASLMRQLSWSHFLMLIPIKDITKRDFYAEMCRIEGWNTRTLRQRIDSMLYERTGLSKKPELVAPAELDGLRKEDRLTPNLVFRDPYFLEFLNLNDRYLEKDLEDAIMRELEQFLLELGGGFCFLARQKRITIDDEDFHIDLLFFHRDLKRIVAIDLKLGDFKPEHKGQMELYLRWLEKYERRPGEEPPLGLILCAGKKKERIELLELDRSGIHVAEYLTVLPSKEVLLEKLHKAIENAVKSLNLRQEFLMKNDRDLSHFAEAQAIIKDLQQAITQKKLVRENVFKINPEWEQLSDKHWQQQEARCWIHGATNVSETTKLERWLFDIPPISDIAQEDAAKCLKYWHAFHQENSEDCRELEITRLEQPLEGEILHDYVLRVAARICLLKSGKNARS